MHSGFRKADKDVRADSELTVDANKTDLIRWELTCPGSGLEYNAIIAEIDLNSTNSLTQPKEEVTYRKIYDKAGDPGYQIVKQTDFVSTVHASGSTQYSITFQVMDKNGNSLGYYKWDPFVNVSN